MNIRNYRLSDAVEIAKLFHGAVHAIDCTAYTKEDLEAWAPTPINYQFWESRLNEKKPFVATINDVIVGFIELESNGHIDCLYTHKNHQGKGIARSLLGHLIKVAENSGIKVLHVEASEIAIPLFERHGFKLIGENIVEIDGQSLTNYNMSLEGLP